MAKERRYGRSAVPYVSSARCFSVCGRGSESGSARVVPDPRFYCPRHETSVAGLQPRRAEHVAREGVRSLALALQEDTRQEPSGVSISLPRCERSTRTESFVRRASRRAQRRSPVDSRTVAAQGLRLGGDAGLEVDPRNRPLRFVVGPGRRSVVASALAVRSLCGCHALLALVPRSRQGPPLFDRDSGHGLFSGLEHPTRSARGRGRVRRAERTGSSGLRSVTATTGQRSPFTFQVDDTGVGGL